MLIMVKVKYTAHLVRLVASIEKLSPRQNDSTQIIKGAISSAAVSTQTAIRHQLPRDFARSKGISVKDLAVKNLEGGDYLWQKFIPKVNQPLKSWPLNFPG